MYCPWISQLFNYGEDLGSSNGSIQWSLASTLSQKGHLINIEKYWNFSIGIDSTPPPLVRSSTPRKDNTRRMILLSKGDSFFKKIKNDGKCNVFFVFSCILWLSNLNFENFLGDVFCLFLHFYSIYWIFLHTKPTLHMHTACIVINWR